VSLTWDASRIAEEVRTVVIGGKRETSPVTMGLVSACLNIGLAGITEANAGDFYARTRLLELVHAPLLTYGDGVTRLLTAENVSQHIGLRTNCKTESATAFRNRLLKHAASRLEGEYRRTGEVGANAA
jgi:hypothetical protein